jgi:type IV pilus assembly protein PilB
VLRILRPDAVNIGLQALGFEQDDYERFLRIIKRPNGIFLVTGPTGSGKTTTLYAALQALNKSDTKIITAEDPVEYNFDGMNQVQIKEEIDLTFERINAAPSSEHHTRWRNSRWYCCRYCNSGSAHGAPGFQHAAHQ